MVFLGKTPHFQHFWGFSTLASTFLRGGQSDPWMKCRGRRDASNGIKYRSSSVSNTVIFGENYPYLVTLWILFYLLGWRWFRQSVLSVFRRYLSHLTCGRVHFCCTEIGINSRSVWFENYFAPPILVRPYFFTFEIFQVFSTDSDSPYVIHYWNVSPDLL